MNIEFKKYQASDAKDLANFLSSQSWSFHSESTCTIESVSEKAESGYYDREGVETFWIEKAGFVKESQPRSSWSDDQGNLHDCVGYAILRGDWEEKKTTPVNWEDD